MHLSRKASCEGEREGHNPGRSLCNFLSVRRQASSPAKAPPLPTAANRGESFENTSQQLSNPDLGYDPNYAPHGGRYDLEEVDDDGIHAETQLSAAPSGDGGSAGPSGLGSSHSGSSGSLLEGSGLLGLGPIRDVRGRHRGLSHGTPLLREDAELQWLDEASKGARRAHVCVQVMRIHRIESDTLEADIFVDAAWLAPPDTDVSLLVDELNEAHRRGADSSQYPHWTPRLFVHNVQRWLRASDPQVWFCEGARVRSTGGGGGPSSTLERDKSAAAVDSRRDESPHASTSSSTEQEGVLVHMRLRGLALLDRVVPPTPAVELLLGSSPKAGSPYGGGGGGGSDSGGGGGNGGGGWERERGRAAEIGSDGLPIQKTKGMKYQLGQHALLLRPPPVADAGARTASATSSAGARSSPEAWTKSHDERRSESRGVMLRAVSTTRRAATAATAAAAEREASSPRASPPDGIGAARTSASCMRDKSAVVRMIHKGVRLLEMASDELERDERSHARRAEAYREWADLSARPSDRTSALGSVCSSTRTSAHASARSSARAATRGRSAGGPGSCAHGCEHVGSDDDDDDDDAEEPYAAELPVLAGKVAPLLDESCGLLAELLRDDGAMSRHAKALAAEEVLAEAPAGRSAKAWEHSLEAFRRDNERVGEAMMRLHEKVDQVRGCRATSAPPLPETPLANSRPPSAALVRSRPLSDASRVDERAAGRLAKAGAIGGAHRPQRHPPHHRQASCDGRLTDGGVHRLRGA